MELTSSNIDGLGVTRATGARVSVLFTDRHGGVSPAPFDSLNLGLFVGDEEKNVIENRSRVASVAELDPDTLALARQVHGADVIEVDAADCGIVGEADVLVTEIPGKAIGILTADCAPVILEGSSRVGVVHAGWRGVVGGAIEAGLAAVGDVQRAWVGPSIHSCCYEVGPEVIAAFEALELPVEKGHVDPGRGAAELLRRAGVTEVVVSETCTGHELNYFSYRREGTTGRQGAFAWLST